jgi:hypothetical protein
LSADFPAPEVKIVPRRRRIAFTGLLLLAACASMAGEPHESRIRTAVDRARPRPTRPLRTDWSIDSTWYVRAGWWRFEANGIFSLYLPPAVRSTTQHSTDSYAAWFEGDGLEVSFDTGPFAGGCSTCGRPVRLAGARGELAGLREVRPRGEERGWADLAFERGYVPIVLRVSYPTSRTRREAERILRSVVVH